MKFRTEIEPLRCAPIGADDSLVLLGSCFADNIGERLAQHGFSVVRNPLGPLFNPMSVAAALTRALDGRAFSRADLALRDGVWHAMDAAARYQSTDADALLAALNRDFAPLREALLAPCVLFVTLGTAYVYRLHETGAIVANCHKLPASEFVRERVSAGTIASEWRPLLQRLAERGVRVVFTVSPVRHVADGLHANNLSKATLLLAVDALGAEYFPAYEIVCDDLRDYRFYASDLKHPSEAAVDYIYERFADAYFSPATKETARARHAEYLRQAHRPGNSIL